MFRINYPFKKEILACGSQRPISFCLTSKDCAYVVNDLDKQGGEGALARYQEQIEQMQKQLKIKPKLIIHELYAQNHSPQYHQQLSKNNKDLRYIAVQHHKAHIASCIGENGLSEKVIAVVFDTAGLGEDGQIWGGGLFAGDLKGFNRIAYLEPSPSHSYSLSMAMLFDYICLSVGLREKIEYEGQGVLELERIINRSTHVAGKNYEFTLRRDKDKFLIQPEAIFNSINQDLQNNISKSIISAAFHNAIIEITRKLCHKISQKEKTKDIVLTGRVFLNKFLFKRLQELLVLDGFRVFSHKHFSCNDQNICFGQAILANAND